ncbi:hypothetical protein WN944_025323 [Citrus x changshan-huyou]|uniref:Uncharacterized protein n=1 Tax=Citrus x changshan-huyou TaxID=2935761 RepID=A0AAP0QDG2_9ROSI
MNQTFVRIYEQRIDLLRAVIIGPQGTPYHSVCSSLTLHSLVNISIYKPPMVTYRSYGLRLNPNLFSNAAGVAGSCWNCSRYQKLLELLVRRSRPRLVAGSARDRRLAAACAVGTAGISRLAVGTARVWLLELLAFGCCLCSLLVAALACGIQGTTTQDMRGSSQASNQSCYTNL